MLKGLSEWLLDFLLLDGEDLMLMSIPNCKRSNDTWTPTEDLLETFQFSLLLRATTSVTDLLRMWRKNQRRLVSRASKSNSFFFSWHPFLFSLPPLSNLSRYLANSQALPSSLFRQGSNFSNRMLSKRKIHSIGRTRNTMRCRSWYLVVLSFGHRASSRANLSRQNYIPGHRQKLWGPHSTSRALIQ